MKLLNLSYLASIIILFSCNDKQELNIIEINDNILYTNLLNDSIISSIDSLVLMGNEESGYCNKPYPEDSIVFFDLDLNHDKIIDFKISHNHFLANESTPTSWCRKFENFQIEISSYNNNGICADSAYQNGFRVPKTLSEGDVLCNDNLWVSNVMAYIQSSSCGCYYENSSNYIGLRLNKNDSLYYAWLVIEASDYQFAIKEYAINMVDAKQINIGQK